MKLKTSLMICTAALALSATMARAAIDANVLADSYLADDYTYVEVKTGPTQTKVEAVKGDIVVEVVYDNETGAILESETEEADDDYLGRVGKDIRAVDEDFEDDEDDEIDEIDEIDDEDDADDADDSDDGDSESEGEKGDGEGDGEGED